MEQGNKEDIVRTCSLHRGTRGHEPLLPKVRSSGIVVAAKRTQGNPDRT